MKIFTAALVAYLMTCSASAEPVPRYAATLPTFSDNTRISRDAMRLRISIASEAAQNERALRLGNMLLCKVNECFRVHMPSYVDISNTSTGTATVIADVVIPITTITDVYFIEPIGGPAIAGHIKLKQPKIMESGFQGLELFFGIQKHQRSGKTTYAPVQMASAYFHQETQLVHYLPSTTTVAKLPLGVVLTFPAGALHEAQLFDVHAQDSGEMYPKIDIYPYLKLRKPVTVDAPAIPGGHSAHEMFVTAHTAEDIHLWGSQNRAPAENSRITLYETNVVKPVHLENAASNPTNAIPDTASKGAQKTCAEILAHPFILGAIHLNSSKNGATLIKACSAIKPYVHILYVNTLHKDIRFTIPYKPTSAGGHGPNLSLLRLPDFAYKSIGLINGFTWKGDWGLFEGDSGKALGIVRSAGVKLGDNVEEGGLFCKDCTVAGEKFVMAFTRDKTRPVFFDTASSNDIADFALNVVSSSTSVIKDGKCNTPGPRDRWSAVGASHGRMIFISSTSTGHSAPEEFCEVFKALAIANALRLDGGPSTSMIVGGKILNELEGIQRSKYGYMRRIAYPLRISY